MENQIQASNKLAQKGNSKYQKLRLVLYTEDFDFSQSFSLYFRKDYHKIITVNDRDCLKQIIKFLRPEILIIDCLVNESLLCLIEEIKSLMQEIKIFIFTSYSFTQKNFAEKINKIADKVLYQPIDLAEFNQLLNFYTAD